MSAEPSPPISVIVPLYNGADFVMRCLEAVLASEGPSYECVVVNDGSTDGGEAIVAQCSDRVRLLNLAEGPHGPAYARNRGAEVARGEILFFVDADVVLAPGALERVAKTFCDQPGVAAVFGSYDASPGAPGLVSQYRNLLHHFVHQNGNLNASTFWAGCGAIRRQVFESVGGFDEKRFTGPSIEDIELGYRLKALGFRILLDKRLQGTHLKRWKLSTLVRTDITARAIPWTRLILETKKLPNDLNVKISQRASVALVALSCLLMPLALVQPQLLTGSVIALLGVTILNRHLYTFFFRQRGAAFAAVCLPLHLLYYLYSGLTYLWVWAVFRLGRIGTKRPASIDLNIPVHLIGVPEENLPPGAEGADRTALDQETVKSL
jgi:glycosyltransferase involved in cell wall biosynthesis